MRVHAINNLNKALQVIQDHGIKLVNISSDDIVGGNPKLILGLIWLIALGFNGQNLVTSYSGNSVEKSLLLWARQHTEPHNVRVNDFSTSWSDGKAFLLILNDHIDDVDLEPALSKHPLARLKIAFDLAHKYFKIEKLLDPEDVHTNKPDKKSILMYVMLLYHAIESKDATDDIVHAGNITDLDEIPLDSVEDKKESMDIGLDDPKADEILKTHPTTSRPLSIATNSSIEINNYQAALEAVLTILLEDEEILSKVLPNPIDFNTAKAQFNDNESFMLKLTEHQQFVGEALEEGSNLLNESQKTSGLSVDDQNEIKQQMILLNERWEMLRVKALDVQSKILSKLADFQIEQIEKLRIFLTNAEDRISMMSAIGPNLQDVEKQIEELKNFKTDLDNQQDLVDSLSNMVVIVNDESGNFSDLEEKLAALGERWSHVFKWHTVRSEKLHHFKVITRWVDAREHDLKTMESIDISEIGAITRRINDLRYCEQDLKEAEKYLIDLRTSIQSSTSTGQALQQIEHLEDRVDALKQIVEAQMHRIDNMGFGVSSDSKLIDRPVSWIDYQNIMKTGEQPPEANDGNLSPQTNKKRKLQKSEKLFRLEGKILEAFSFLEGCDEKLKALQRQSLKDQMNILNKLEESVKEKEEMMDELNELLGDCEIDDPSRNLTVEKNHIHEIEERYNRLHPLIIELKNDTDQLLNKDKFYKSLTGFKLVLADSRDW